jgi:hypothetical protein
MQIQTDSCCGLISTGRRSDFKTFRMPNGSRRKKASNLGADTGDNEETNSLNPSGVDHRFQDFNPQMFLCGGDGASE